MAVYRRCGKCSKKIKNNEVCECRKSSRKKYRKNVRYNKENSKFSRFYDSTHWKNMSIYIRRKYLGACLLCYSRFEIFRKADLVHHIIELKEDYDKRLEEDNLIPLCHGCHNNIHSDYTKNKIEELYRAKNIFENEFL